MLVLVAMAACESEDETAPATAGPIPIGDLRGEAVGAQCDFLARCGWQPDALTCRRVDFASNELLQLIVDVTRGQLPYNEIAARAWVEGVRAQPCSRHNASKERELAQAWEAVFAGPVPMGSGCWVDGECEGTGVCDRSACEDSWECCSGACAPAPGFLPFGAPCGQEGALPCEDGAYCGEEGVCNPRADVGEPCSDSNGCGDDQGCDWNTGTCYLLVLPDEACDPTFDSPCRDYDRFCNGTCVRLPGDGQPCDPEGPGCLGYAMCVEGTCRRRALEGEPCDVVECLGDLQCYDGICGKPAVLTCG